MKKIESNGADWQDRIFKDLDYIKKNLRYPWKGSRRAPLIFWAAMILLIILLQIAYFFAYGTPLRKSLAMSAWMTFILVMFSLAIIRYLKSLKFNVIKSGLPKHLNLKLTANFLDQKHLLIFHHPDCEDIMQILSRPISNESEQREVLIFIADENRILINSHFTENGWRLPNSNLHDKQITAELNQFIEKYKAQKETQLGFNF